MTQKVETTVVTLSSGIEIEFREMSKRMFQDLFLYLAKSQLQDEKGNIIDTGNMDKLEQKEQLKLIDNAMDIVDTILQEPEIVDVKLPKNNSWLHTVLRRSYVRAKLSEYGIEKSDVVDDRDLQRFLYIRYVAIEDDEDFNVILNNTLLKDVDDTQ